MEFDMKVGTKTVSSMQKRLLERAQQESTLTRRVVPILEQVVSDNDILIGKEELHPDWLRVFAKEKNKLKELCSPRLFQDFSAFFSKMSPYDPSLADINPTKQPVAFLLGAGASKPEPSNIPTVKQFLPHMLTGARRLDREDLNKLADFCETREIDNIEDLLTAAQLATFCSRNPGVFKLVDFLLYRWNISEEHEYRKLQRNLDLSSVAFLHDTLQVLFSLLSKMMLPAKPNNAHMAIIRHVKQHPQSQIVTTNYDCCIDLALRDAAINFCYGVPFSNMASQPSNQIARATRLTKLHGSLNWFYCDTCQNVQLVDIKKAVNEYLHDKSPYPVIAVCRACGGQRRPLLVPPLAVKFDIAPPLTRLLDQAENAFESAKLIIVVGFSFADADLYISRMLSKSMQLSEERKIVIVDPDFGVVEKVRRKFKARIPGFNPERIIRAAEDCAVMLPEFLTGKLQRQVAHEAVGAVKVR